MTRNQISSAQFLIQARKCNLQADSIENIEELVLSFAQDGALYHEQEGYELRVLPWRQYNVVYTIHQISGAILIVALKPSGPMSPLNRKSESWVRALAKKLLLAGLIAELKELIKKFPDIDFTLALTLNAAISSDVTSERYDYSVPDKAVVNQCLGEIGNDDLAPWNAAFNGLPPSGLEHLSHDQVAASDSIDRDLFDQLSTSRIAALTKAQIMALTMAQIVVVDSTRNLRGLNRWGHEWTIGLSLLLLDTTFAISSMEDSNELGFFGSGRSPRVRDFIESVDDPLDFSEGGGRVDNPLCGRASTSKSHSGINLISIRKTSNLVCSGDRRTFPSTLTLAYLSNRLHCNENRKNLSTLQSQ